MKTGWVLNFKVSESAKFNDGDHTFRGKPQYDGAELIKVGHVGGNSAF
jgi:hypothetical protein